VSTGTQSLLWPRGVVFDLDGTLVDSLGDIADAVNAGLAACGLGPLADDDIRQMVGRGAEVTIRRALAKLGGRPGHLDAVHSAFLKAYHAQPAARTLVYPGGRELLAWLRDQGSRVAICTNKPALLTEPILRALALDTAVDAWIGASDRLPRKPDPAMLRSVLDTIGIRPADAVMVGDSATDVGTARALGIPVVVVSFGYTAIPAKDLGADAVIDHLADLPDALSQIRDRI
jgi:phosphoglycolate phosphatase